MAHTSSKLTESDTANEISSSFKKIQTPLLISWISISKRALSFDKSKETCWQHGLKREEHDVLDMVMNKL